MIYDVRTYNLKPGTVPEFERRFGAALPERQKISPFGAFWHTDIGPLNQVIHVWPYESLEHMRQCRAAAHATGKWPANLVEFMLDQDAEIMIPAPFMRELKPARLGNIYEMRTYVVVDRTIPTVIERWGEVIAEREKLSPLAACWYSEFGRLNKFVNLWAYESYAERARIRDEAQRRGIWPPKILDFIRSQEIKILIPAAFSPLH